MAGSGMNTGELVITVSLLVQVAAGVLAALLLGKKLSRGDKCALGFWVFNALVNITMCIPYAVMSLVGNVKDYKNFVALMFQEYAKADKRYGVADPNMICIELAQAVVGTSLSIAVITAILQNKKWRHLAQLVLLVVELYGVYMMFAPELISGLKNFNPAKLVQLFVMNGVFLVIRLALLAQSLQVLCGGKKQAPSSGASTPRSTGGRYNLRAKKE
ncbi:emopamil-binding protein-like [Lingula anatina]|uniref:Emopamil-binding protein-like n=1 Tax=Lingula anatina TaxID=7574 RepID=A0A1S3I375_LINAN|nr:emopamil-binding protein-like [Lingula anatina]|eukprot:XP_013392286.1 emopamil-binding protein-like [Lingula anatina]